MDGTLQYCWALILRTSPEQEVPLVIDPMKAVMARKNHDTSNLPTTDEIVAEYDRGLDAGVQRRRGLLASKGNGPPRGLPLLRFACDWFLDSRDAAFTRIANY
jgi:hypothetical protein